MEDIVEVVALVITGPMVGVEIAVAAFTNPIFDRLPDDAFRLARSDGSRVLGRVMPFWYIATLMMLVAAAVVTSGDWAITTAAVLMGLVVLLTVTMLVPINNRVGAWSQTADVDRDLAGRWDRLHWLRVALLVVLFVLLAVAVV
jgi:anthrone oxygenase-like protein